MLLGIIIGVAGAYGVLLVGVLVALGVGKLGELADEAHAEDKLPRIPEGR